jgi:3-mercaptopyruvate sulfurtransferase SseA
MSYNAALRAINLGYTNVLWYRGGIEAWQQAGLPVQPAQQFGQGGPQQPNQQYPQQQYPQQPQPQQQGGWPNQ